MSTIFWAVLAANVLAYLITDAFTDIKLKYQRKKRREELEAYLQFMEDEEADDEDDDE